MLLTSKDGTHVYADVAGNPSKPAIVFLHGLSLSSIVFDSLFSNPKLLDRYYLVRYDMRGHGRSGKPTNPKGYLSARFAEDYATVAAAFNLKKALFVGWSLGATAVCDIASHLPSDTLGGIVYLNALPYIGPIMGRIGTQVILGFQPGLITNDDVNLSLSTIVDFIESLFVKPDAVPFALKCSWMGCAVLQSPKVRALLLTRSQDPSDLFKLGAEGLPLLVLSGTVDSQVKGDVVVKEMQEQFKNVDFNMIEGGGHALFYEFPDQVINSIDSFASKVLEEQRWLLDLASQINSSSILHGFDIHDKLFPSSAPSNVSFSVNSVITLLQGWANRFDLVHQRLLKAALHDAEWPIVVTELFRVTRLGGWLQLVELDKWNSREATRSHQALVMHLFNARGMLYDCVEQLLMTLEQTRFTNVKVQKRGLAASAWAGLEGNEVRDNFIGVYGGMKTPILNARGFGIVDSEKAFDDLLNAVQREWDQTEGTEIEIVIICAQKPLALA
ncbi:hypothetical protein EW146_g9449 [Bondarzewia mesenterica]|uniref:AB hydrolase-1 domain-containing protein n=1 Tax=Bondarzewia mesenterica TaxID=1095465 RepID=A0A4S4L6F1_9AGAM|nr:hypothetical protein EW146_g9449 [Bondarzewia mesenterica]